MDLQSDRIRVAVIGTGTMGKGIAQILAQSEHITSICWKGSSSSSASKASAELEQIWSRLTAKKRLEESAAQHFHSKISIVETYSDLKSADIVIEAISENMEQKASIFSELAKIAHEGMILASNTSSLSITALAAMTPFPGNVVGLHFFNPAPVMKLAEVICGLLTTETTTNSVMSLARSLGKEPVLVQEAPGFIVNRMLIPMINEAISILAEGVASAEEIDKAMRLGANHPIGPLALSDLIGNDVGLSIMETLHSETGDPKYRAHALLRKMVRAGLLGRKTGQGFYRY